MSAHLPSMIATLLSARIAYTVATDNDVPGTTAGGAGLGAEYDKWPLGQRVIVTGNGNRYTKTSLTLYADGGRITQESTASGGTILAGNGTAAAPSYSYASSPSDGAYLVAAGTLGFSTGGTQRATLSSTALGLSVPTIATTTDLTIDLRNGTSTPTLAIRNSDTGVANVTIDGGLTVGFNASLTGGVADQALLSAAGSGVGLRVISTALDTIGVSLTTGTAGVSPILASIGANAGLTLASGGGTGALLLDPGTGTGGVRIGSSTSSRFAFGAATPIAPVSAATNADTLGHLAAWLQTIGLMVP